MKRILLLFSALMLSCTALWAHDVEIDGIYYNLDETNKTAEVTYRGNDYNSYNEYSGSVTIPETTTYNSEIYSVTSIGKGAFSGCSELTSVTIPNSVTSIGVFAFNNCSGLTSITIPNSVTSIGKDAFYGTGFYNDESNWDNGVLYIDNCIIEAKSDVVKGSYTIKKGTRIIGDEAFEYCDKLTSVTIPNSVTFIGSDAFFCCSRLTSITIPNSVTSIGEYTFSGCSGLTSVTIPNSVTSIGEYAFYGCSRLTSITIPNSVTSIGEYAFSGCSGLTSVTIPNSVTSIGSDVFYGCSGLTSVIWNAKNCEDFKYIYYDMYNWEYTSPFYNIRSNITSFTFGNEVEHIPAYLCYGMSKLTEITIPNSVTSIGEYAFYYCSGLTSVTIPNSVTSIGDGTFYYCSALTSVTIPNSVTSIGKYAYRYCSGLTSVIIPNSVTSIGEDAFYNCSGLTKVNYLGTVDKWVEIDFEYSWANPTRYAKDLYINNELITDVKISAADSIKNYAFYNCQSIKSVEIGESVTSIGEDAFSGCSGLTSVTIPNSVTSIGEDAFYECSGLTEVTIPNSVTSIGSDAFYGCSGLTSVIWNAKNCEDFKYIYYDMYNWEYTSPFYNIRSNITSFTFGNEVEHIPAYLCYGMSKLTEITIPNSVTSIGEYAFYYCSGLTSVTIPNSVTSIGKYAYRYCSGLTSVIIPNSVTSIGEDAFYNCSGLTSVIWNAKNCEDFSSYSSSPFYDIRSNITSFTFGNEVEHIPAYLCYGMSKLTEMTIPNSVTSIGEGAFYNCSGLTSVTIPNSVTSIGKYAYRYCSGLTSVIWNAKNCEDFSSYSSSPFYDIRSNITSFTLGNEVEHIPAYLCYGMSKLTEMTIPNSVTSIGDYAFIDCSGLTSVTIPNSVTSIGSNAFYGCSGLTSVIWNAKNCEDFSSSAYSPFYDIRSSITSFTFGNEVEHIPAYLCYGMSKLTEITIPNSVTSIGSDAFSGCSGLTSVTIPNSVTSIGYSAFYDCSGLTKVNYLVTVDKWVEIDFEDSRSNPTYYAKDLYINNELLTDVKITTADSIKNYAFYNCQSIKSVEIGESVTSIGEDAFYGCDKLRKVTAYPTTVPNAYESSFAHYNAYLYVPCDVYDDYFLDDVFGTFKVTECIAAEEVDAPDKVEIEVDEDNNANVIWPSTDGAKKYELEISKDGEVFCTLLFNENGQLTSIDFGNRSASVGFQFTVTGLDSASKYAYSMVAMDKKGNELQSYKGTFTTNGYVPGPGEEEEPVSITETLADANIIVSGGTISADADFSIYNTIGQNVTAFNGSLQPGVYLVSIENNIVKVMVK